MMYVQKRNKRTLITICIKPQKHCKVADRTVPEENAKERRKKMDTQTKREKRKIWRK